MWCLPLFAGKIGRSGLRGAAAVLVLTGFALSAAQARPAAAAGVDVAGAQSFKAISMVDCLLPGQLRRSGRNSYMGPRLPVRVTAERCEILGGEYVQSDRATLASSLAVWKAKADEGDAQAQYYVGQFYEKGMDVEPDFAEAVKWYRKAAAQNHVAATLSLVDLMAEGKGMPADPVAAYNLYQKTMGITEELVRATEADQRVQAEREKLLGQKRESEAEIARLRAEIMQLKDKARSEAETRAVRAKQAQLQSLEQRSHDSVAALERLDEPLMRTATQVPSQRDPGAASLLKVGDTSFGRYYALVIGVQDYPDRPLKTPVADADAVASLLRSQYGFKADVLHNARAGDVDAALGRYARLLKPGDNFVLYFAGHGIRDGAASAWILADGVEYPTQNVAAFTGAMQARTVLVIADTCFGGALTGTSKVWASSGISAFNDQLAANRYYLGNKGRYVLSSGGDAPATDEGGGAHSVFASALLDALSGNHRILTERGLLRAISGSVADAAGRLGLEQKPDLQVIRDGGDNEDGLFFFVPVAAGSQTRAG